MNPFRILRRFRGRTWRTASRVLTVGLIATLSGCDRVPLMSEEMATQAQPRIISLDYCADQYVLKFVPKTHIVGVSPDARKYFSYMRDAHPEIPAVRPMAEDVLVHRPTVVVRSYGGGPGAQAFFERSGVKVVQLGFAASLNDVRQQILEISSELGARSSGEAVVADVDARLRQLQRRQGSPNALYTTPGGVTTGPGSLVHKMMEEAGLANYETRSGWRDLPLERLVTEQPELLAKATFGDATTHVDPWTRSRHPHARALAERLPSIEFEGAWTSCGGWFLVDAIEKMSQPPDTLSVRKKDLK